MMIETSDQNSSISSNVKKSHLPTMALVGITIVSFFIHDDMGDSRWNWADCLGRAIGSAILSLLSSILLLGLLILVGTFKSPTDQGRLQFFRTKIGIPLLISGGFWLWHASEISTIAKEKYKQAQEFEDTRLESIKLGMTAEPVLRIVRREHEESLKEYLRESNDIDVEGWSAARVKGTKWLTKFVFSENGVQKSWTFEYDEYLGTIKSVAQDTYGGLTWYGPVK